MKELTKVFKGINISITDRVDGTHYFDVSGVANKFGKNITDWKNSKRLKEYLIVLENSKTHKNQLILEKNNRLNIHEDLIVNFARFISVEFEVFCDMTIKDLLRGGKSLFDKREKELLSQIDNTQKQLQISQKETKKARRKVYAYERDGKFQCVTHIIRQTKANISSDTLNKMLLSKGYIERKEVVVKKYFPNDVETISDEDGSVLVHKDTALKVMEDFDVEFESDSQMVMEF